MGRPAVERSWVAREYHPIFGFGDKQEGGNEKVVEEKERYTRMIELRHRLMETTQRLEDP